MKSTVNIYFNGDGVEFPPGNAWGGFKGLNDARLFQVAANSWERNGWNVRRMVTPEKAPYKGEIIKQYHWYKETYWNFISQCEKISRDGDKLHVFATMDIINQTLYLPESFFDTHLTLPHFINFQREHFSLGAFAANNLFFKQALICLQKFDEGKIKARGDLISDESLLREHLGQTPYIVNLPFMTFASNVTKHVHSLLHFARSTVAFDYKRIPVTYIQ